MRIVGGQFSGRKLAALGAGAPEAHLRPTTDRVREAIFNLLAHGPYPPLDGARALDLFAGSGALGLEALSRGAERAVFVDDHPSARALLRRNIEALGLTGATKIFRRDATRLGANRGRPFDYVFLDPPYDRNLETPALLSAQRGGWLAACAIAVVDRSGDAAPLVVDGFETLETRRYGGSSITLLRHAATPDAAPPDP